MKVIFYRCKKCGYSVDIPEKTASVLCGNCGTWNRPRSLFAALDQPVPGEREQGSILQKVPGNIYSEIPGATPEVEKSSRPESNENEINPAKPGLFSLVTLIFVIAPLLTFVMEKFNLPPAMSFIIIAAVIIVITILKKRS